MVTTLFRTIVLYLVVIFSLRIMGKRQIGELQPGELVITILISECAAAPIQDLNRPIISGIVAIFSLVILEILFSFLTLKLPFFRKIIDGTPVIVIDNGKINQKTMKKLRLSIEDLTNTLRQNGYFNLEDIAYCIVETDGNLSILPTPKATPATAQMVGYKQENQGLPGIIVADGKINRNFLQECNLTESDLQTILKKEKVTLEQIFILTANRKGKYNLIRKDDAK